MNLSIFMILTIILITGLLILFFAKKSNVEKKLIFILSGVSIMVYSGLGIAFYNVDDMYLFHYTIFLITFFSSISFILNPKILIFGRRFHNLNIKIFIDKVISKSSVFINIVTVIFFVTLLINIIYPQNRVFSIFNFSSPSIYGIHQKINEHRSNLILLLSDTLYVASKPFFFVFLYQLIEKNKGKNGFLFVLLWIFLEYGKYEYLSRYEIVVYIMFLIMYLSVWSNKILVFDYKTILISLVIGIILIPFLLNYIYIRQGNQSTNLSFFESFIALFESESYYPIYYDLSISNAGIISPILYILWLSFLPIPSVIWASKPTIAISDIFTSIVLGNIPVSSINYSVALPSILGESFMIFGSSFYWIEALLMGIIIGIYFRFFFKSKKMIFLSIYMLIMLVTIGRGGSQSYMSVIVNGSIIFIIWIIINFFFVGVHKND